MRTKSLIWETLVGKLTLNQYTRVLALRENMTYDAMAHAVLQVSKSKAVRQLAHAVIAAPVTLRYTFMSEERNSFGDQIIKYYDIQEHCSKTIVNQEGSHEMPNDVMIFLNMQDQEKKAS